MAGEDRVAEIEQVRYARKSSQPDDWPQANGRVQATKDFDTLEPGPIAEAAMQAGHQFVVRLADRLRLKRSIADV